MRGRFRGRFRGRLFGVVPAELVDFFVGVSFVAVSLAGEVMG